MVLQAVQKKRQAGAFGMALEAKILLPSVMRLGTDRAAATGVHDMLREFGVGNDHLVQNVGNVLFELAVCRRRRDREYPEPAAALFREHLSSFGIRLYDLVN